MNQKTLTRRPATKRPGDGAQAAARARLHWRPVFWPAALACLGLGFALIPLALRRIFFYWDNAQQHFVQTQFLHDALRRGSFPDWWPAVGNGAPVIAEGQAAHFQPVRLLLAYLFTPEVAFMLEIGVYLSVAGLGTYYFLREFRLQRSACFLGGVCQMFGSFSVVFIRNAALHRSFFLLPLAMLFAERFIRESRNRHKYAVASALVLGYQLLAGHPTFAVVTIVATTTYLVARVLQRAWRGRASLQAATKQLGVHVLQWSVVAAAGVLVAAVQVVPTLLHVSQSIREGGLSFQYAVAQSLPAELVHLPQLILPFVYRQGDALSQATQWGSYFNKVPLLGMYIGMLPVMLALWAVCRPRRWPDPTWPLLACAVIATAFALGPATPLFPALWSLPVLNGIRFPSRFLMWASFSLSCLAAIGFHRLLVYNRFARRATARDLAPFILVGLSLVMCAGLLLWKFSTSEPPIDIAPDFRVGLAISAVLYSISLLIGFGLLRGRSSVRRYVVGLALLFVLMDLWYFRSHSGYAATTPVTRVRAVTPAIAALSRDRDVFRVMSLVSIEQGWNRADDLTEFMQANTTALWGLESADVYFSLFLKRYYAVHESVLWELAHSPPAAVQLAGFLGALNVKYVVAPGETRLAGWRAVQRTARAVVWQNPAFLPRAVLVGRVVPERVELREEWHDRSIKRLERYRSMVEHWQTRLEDAQIVDNVMAKPVDFSTTAVVAGAGAPALDGVKPSGSVRFSTPQPDRMRVRVRSDRPAFLAIASNYYPGWTATVNGAPARIYRTNFVGIGVPVPAGVSEVVLSFRTPGVRIGLVVTLLSLLVCVLVLTRSRSPRSPLVE